MSWRLFYTSAAQKDAKKLAAVGLRDKVQALLDVLEIDPFATSPPFEKLAGDLQGTDSRRINIQHRLVYQILVDEHAVKVIRMWTRYE